MKLKNNNIAMKYSETNSIYFPIPNFERIVIKTLVSLEAPANNNKKKPNTKNPFTNHLAGSPFADVDRSLDDQESSKKGIEYIKTNIINGKNNKSIPKNSNHNLFL